MANRMPPALALLVAARRSAAKKELGRIEGELDRIMGEMRMLVVIPKKTAFQVRRLRLLEADFVGHYRVKTRYQQDFLASLPEYPAHLRPEINILIDHAVAEWQRSSRMFSTAAVSHRFRGGECDEEGCIALLRRTTGLPASQMWQPRREALWMLHACLGAATPHRQEFKELLTRLFIRLYGAPPQMWAEMPILEK